MHRNKVLFPEPEGPMMQITCPDVTCKFALSTASMSPKCFVTLITSITTLAFAAIMSPISSIFCRPHLPGLINKVAFQPPPSERDAFNEHPNKHAEIGRASCRERVCQYV